MSVLLFSMETRRKQASTSKHSQKLSILPLPVVWEEMKGICAPSMPDLQRTGKSREGRTHGARSEEERGAAKSQPPPAHTHRGRARVSTWQTPPPQDKDQNTQLEESGSFFRPPQIKNSVQRNNQLGEHWGASLPLRIPRDGFLSSGHPGEDGPLSPHGTPLCVCGGGWWCGVQPLSPDRARGWWGSVPPPSRTREGE